MLHWRSSRGTPVAPHLARGVDVQTDPPNTNPSSCDGLEAPGSDSVRVGHDVERGPAHERDGVRHVVARRSRSAIVARARQPGLHRGAMVDRERAPVIPTWSQMPPLRLAHRVGLPLRGPPASPASRGETRPSWVPRHAPGGQRPRCCRGSRPPPTAARDGSCVKPGSQKSSDSGSSVTRPGTATWGWSGSTRSASRSSGRGRRMKGVDTDRVGVESWAGTRVARVVVLGE